MRHFIVKNSILSVFIIVDNRVLLRCARLLARKGDGTIFLLSVFHSTRLSTPTIAISGPF